MDGGQGAAQVGFAGQRLQDAVRRHDQAERPRAPRQFPDVAADEGGPETRGARSRTGLGPGQLGAGPVQHRRRSVDTDDAPAVAGDGHQDAAGAAAQFEHPALGARREAAPERDVAAADGAGVLPVVERRVLVPAVPALSHGALAFVRQEPRVGRPLGARPDRLPQVAAVAPPDRVVRWSRSASCSGSRGSPARHSSASLA